MKKLANKKNKLKSKEKALSVFDYAIKNVPAYKKFIKKYKINPKKIIKNGDFENIPIMEKDNYLRAYSPLELIAKRKFPPMISASSGSSGKPFYWPRGDEHEIQGGELHKKIIGDIFQLKNKRTLAIICFSMGNWIAGTFTLASLREISRNDKFNLTTITPGIDKSDVIITLKDFAPFFESVILIGYPPFIMDVIIEAKESRINLKKLNLHFIIAGENFSEKWRTELLKLSDIPNKNNRVISIYGTADAGSLGHENPFTLMIRKLVFENEKFKKELLGDVNFIPTIVGYYPDQTFFETKNNELIFTTKSGIPLIRYNIKDHGLLLSNNYVRSILKKYKLDKKISKKMNKWKNPLVVIKGRNDVSVTFYALNIYPENIKSGLEDKTTSRLVTGKYIAKTEQTRNFKTQKLFIDIELKKDIIPNSKNKKIISDIIIKHLLKLNTEYRKLFNSINEKALPVINLIPYGHEQFITKKAKHKWFKR